MARSLSGTSQYYSVGSTLVSAVPLTVAGWVYNTTTTGGTILSVTQDINDAESLGLDTAGSTDVRCYTYTNANGFTSSTKTGGAPQNTWAHVGGVWASSTSRTAYSNGVAATTDTGTGAPLGLNRTTLGQLYRPSMTSATFPGSMAEWAAWNVALSADEMAMLSTGVRPWKIRPAALIAYWPLLGRATNEEDWAGSFTMVPSGSPTVADHPLIIPATAGGIILPAAAAGGTVALTGQSATSAGGTLTPNTSAALSGQVATTAGGTLVPNTSIGLTGLQLTVGYGTLTPVTGTTVALTGLGVTSYGGSLSPSMSIGLTGLHATLAKGSLSVYGQSIWTLQVASSTSWAAASTPSTTWTRQ